MNKDLFNIVKLVSSLVPAVRTSDTNGGGIDLRGFDGCIVAVHWGDSADTLSGTVKVEPFLEESDDNSSYTAVAAADIISSDATPINAFGYINAPGDDQTVACIGYKGRKRYVRPVLNFSGTHTNGIPCGAFAVLGFPADAPVGNKVQSS